MRSFRPKLTILENTVKLAVIALVISLILEIPGMVPISFVLTSRTAGAFHGRKRLYIIVINIFKISIVIPLTRWADILLDMLKAMPSRTLEDTLLPDDNPYVQQDSVVQ
jgi:hypothetical protein